MVLLKKTSLILFSIFSIFVVWLIGYGCVQNPLLLPSPAAVFVSLFKLFTTHTALQALGMSLFRLVVAMIVALGMGGALGMLAGFKENVSIFLQPIVSILRTVPVISIIVILLILFHFTITPYLITFLMIFPLVYQAFHDAISDMDSELVDVYKLEDNHFWNGLLHCYFPLIKQKIKTVLMQSAGLGIKVLVMAEYLAQTKTSIGNALYLAKTNLAYDDVFAWTILLILLAILLEIAISHLQRIEIKILQETEIKKSKLD